MSGPDLRSPEAQAAYPTELRERERARWQLGLPARFGNQAPPDRPRIGVALSGGGIRSATFSLGVFQALAGRGFLKHIDFLSTISGGGYFGSFLGALFARPYITSPDDAASVLLEWPPDPEPPAPEPPLPPHRVDLNIARGRVIPWLREHGRYLSPRGAGDQLLFLVVLFRNWLALNIVIALPLIALALAMQTLRFWERFSSLAPSGDLIWWSPWIGAALIPSIVVPSFAWAYFLRDDRAKMVIAGLLAALVVSTVVVLSFWFGDEWRWPLVVTSKTASFAAVAVFVMGAVAFAFLKLSGDDVPLSNNLLGQWLRAALGASVAIGFAGLLDSLGQTLYFHIRHESLGPWLAAIAATIGGAAAFARQITVLLGPRASGDRARLPLSIAAGLAAVVLVLLLGTAYSTAAHAIAWNFEKPVWDAGQSAAARGNLVSVLGWLVSLLVLSWGFGQKWRFVNYSTHQPLYSARLARAYLGASNPNRWAATRSVLEPEKGDDFKMEEYWPPIGGGARETFSKGAPQHIVSVTINATVGRSSQIEQRDRRGLGFAIGPAGLSVGVRDHAVFGERASGARREIEAQPNGHQGLRVFNYQLDPDAQDPRIYFNGERLNLSMWTGLSGAAFSTGVGSRTSLGLSLLTGFTNVRLGYWWEAGFTPESPSASYSFLRQLGRGVGGVFQRVLPVHRYLADEFLARFPGVSRKRWYLSDGGHFENLGGYELIRRRLPLVILIDSGEDGSANFNDLGNLVRKARTDFDAEISFLTPVQLNALRARLGVSPEKKWAVGPLEALRPESRAYAALATVTYESESPCTDDGLETTLLVYVKPSLMKDEEAIDLVNYGRQHPAFPHESTADQFFDEAQWESYRKLGESIACRVWTDLGLDDPGKFIRLFTEEAATWRER